MFVTVYNRASLPTLPSLTVTTPDQTLPVCEEDGFFALRVVRKDGTRTAAEATGDMKVLLTRGAALPEPKKKI